MLLVWGQRSCYHRQASTNVEPVSRPVAVLPSPFKYLDLSYDPRATIAPACCSAFDVEAPVVSATGTVPSLDTSPTFSAATAQVSSAVPAVATTVQVLSCCLGISSIPRSVADLQCCHSFSIYYSACCRYQRQCSCCISATTFVDLVSVSIKVNHPAVSIAEILGRDSVTRTHRLLLQPRRHIQVQSWSNRWLCNHLKISIDEYTNIAYNYYA